MWDWVNLFLQSFTWLKILYKKKNNNSTSIEPTEADANTQ